MSSEPHTPVDVPSGLPPGTNWTWRHWQQSCCVFGREGKTVLTLPGMALRSPSSIPWPNRCTDRVNTKGPQILICVWFSRRNATPFSKLRPAFLVKVKVKVTLVQALRLCTGRTAHRGSRGIALPFHDHGTRRGWEVSVTPLPLFTPGKDPVPIVQEAGWAQGRSGQVRKISPPHRDSISGPSSQSLYLLSYSSHAISCAVQFIGAFHEIRKN